ncbi:hypothetical protein AGABI2DRAFT_189551 [Agaricus bisporus var. bisporus H97]|uniref:hypothetical protein n=1 Tax=Agaricus bisporus var. bisporus (strain H97 / ATCC MYA-4626 / FGSC 10389) TaxID=936046 RepID=UPI00029F7063|nr:hypothetical protein AGABI2DRAFT_189551 [Agaricus bisporus var. bisporus H97]EKV51300.1 hypothetical protein AGABI2DRAFT_189551 [Agaricus bisporus var. bisporus H97]
MENELHRFWLLFSDLSDQLTRNQELANSLKNQAVALKGRAEQTCSGFSLRRFNVDISQEEFDSEFERLNAQIIIENQTLLQENKQLSTLLKEYENTMETIMTKFRNHSVAAEQHELTLAKHYDTLVQTRESQSTAADLTVNANILHSLRRLSHHLRLLLRSMVGEDSDSETSSSPALDLVTDPSSLSEGIEELQQLVQELSDQTDDEFDNKGRPDWTVQREWEIRRLEEENAMLRKALEIDAENMEARGLEVDAGQIDVHRTMVIANHRAQAENSYWAGVPLETGSHTQRTPDSQFLSRLNIQQQGQPQSPVQPTPQQSQKRATDSECPNSVVIATRFAGSACC